MWKNYYLRTDLQVRIYKFVVRPILLSWQTLVLTRKSPTDTRKKRNGHTKKKFKIKLKSKYKPIFCALKNYNLNSREKFEPGPGFEPQTSRSLALRSTT